MKKILTPLTGIVFIIAILAASGCKQPPKQNHETDEENNLIEPQERDPKVFISLKAVSIDGEVHLEMFDSREPKCKVIDGLVTVVIPEDTVIWRKAPNSNIHSIDQIILHADYGIFSEFFTVDDSLIALQIPSTEIGDTIIKYDIKFTLRKDGGTHTIDPYLRIED
jgi:hypothetical protein